MKRVATGRSLAILGLIAVVMNACGGGGDGGSLQSGAYDLQTGYANLVTAGLTTAVNLSGTVISDGVSTAFTGTGTFTLAAGASTTFDSAAAVSQQETLSGTVTADGQSAPYTALATNYYAAGTYAYLGEMATGLYAVAQSPLVYPDSVVAGSSAVLGTVDVYSDSTMSTPLGSSKVSYAVTASDVADALTVTITTLEYDTMNNLIETDVATYNLSSGNVLSLVSITSQTPSGNVSITAQ